MSILEVDREFANALDVRANPDDATRAARQQVDDLEEPLSAGDITDIMRDLDERPQDVMPFFNQVWDAHIGQEEVQVALSAIRDALILSRGTSPAEVVPELPNDLRDLTSPVRGWGGLALGPVDLPDGWWPDRPAAPKIEIDTKNWQFETDRDWTSWVWNAGSGYAKANWLKRRTRFLIGQYDYEIKQKDARIALFSDFGTGLYHSKYIAHFMKEKNPHLAVHLGDVYYAGKQGEFDTRFRDVLNTYFFANEARSQLYCLNANHEMYSRSIPYFSYLDQLRGRQRSEQEGSYFRIRVGDSFQIIGLDTASTIEGKIANGRFGDAILHDWLRVRLLEGRAENRVNILLTSDYPYHIGSTKKTSLYYDLQPHFSASLIDLWFWGDSHYCALFSRGPETPFVGSCIGHGGYPYYKRDPRGAVGSLAAPRFVETRSRFHGTNVRSDMGNNGFAVLQLSDANKQVSLQYVDWRNNQRAQFDLGPKAHGFDFI